MDFAEKIKNFLTKLQNLPENKKKIVLWTIVSVLALIMGFFWIKGAMDGLSKMGQSISNVQIPQINVPNIGGPNVQEIENQLNTLNTNTK